MVVCAPVARFAQYIVPEYFSCTLSNLMIGKLVRQRALMFTTSSWSIFEVRRFWKAIMVRACPCMMYHGCVVGLSFKHLERNNSSNWCLCVFDDGCTLFSCLSSGKHLLKKRWVEKFEFRSRAKVGSSQTYSRTAQTILSLAMSKRLKLLGIHCAAAWREWQSKGAEGRGPPRDVLFRHVPPWGGGDGQPITSAVVRIPHPELRWPRLRCKIAGKKLRGGGFIPVARWYFYNM